MYLWHEVKKCFTDVERDSFDMQMKILETEAYVVHLNSKIIQEPKESKETASKMGQ